MPTCYIPQEVPEPAPLRGFHHVAGTDDHRSLRGTVPAGVPMLLDRSRVAARALSPSAEGASGAGCLPLLAA